jgi:oligopeptidase A
MLSIYILIIYDLFFQKVGQFYLDAYIRDNKGYAGGDKGWYIPIRPRSKIGPSIPLGSLVLSLSAPNYGKPSLLSFNEVQEVLRNMGSLIQHMLSGSEWSDLSGKQGIEWDALEFVGLFMTHWLYTPDVISLISGHWSTGQCL